MSLVQTDVMFHGEVGQELSRPLHLVGSNSRELKGCDSFNFGLWLINNLVGDWWTICACCDSPRDFPTICSYYYVGMCSSSSSSNSCSLASKAHLELVGTSSTVSSSSVAKCITSPSPSYMIWLGRQWCAWVKWFCQCLSDFGEG